MKQRRLELGSRNLVGARVTEARQMCGMKQVELLARLQTRGIDISVPALSLLEGQKRPVTDIELAALSDRTVKVQFEEGKGRLTFVQPYGGVLTAAAAIHCNREIADADAVAHSTKFRITSQVTNDRQLVHLLILFNRSLLKSDYSASAGASTVSAASTGASTAGAALGARGFTLLRLTSSFTTR